MEVPPKTALCFLLLCFCFTSSFADPNCVSCRGAGGPFLKGNVYKYKVEGHSVTRLPGSPDDVSTLDISATAEVFAESSCQYVLKLSNVDVKTADGKSYSGLTEDCAKPVKFSYVDGKLDSLCGESDDRGAGLNVKRAIISLLNSAKKQTSGSDTAYENDVFGICPTDFTFTKQGGKLTIQKLKNLNRCALREDFNFPFPTSPYQAVQSSFGAFETSPLFGGELKVTQEIENGVLKKASGEEHYIYTPFLNQESRATVHVSYKLNLESASTGNIPANVNTPKSVFFEVVHESDGVNNHDKIFAALQQAAAALDPEAKPEAAKEFSKLVNVIEQGSKADILQAYNAAQGSVAKNLFLDGLLYAGSAESVEAAAELLKSGQISKDAAVLWYIDLNFAKHVSRGSLTAVLPLLSGNDVPHQAYLGIGSLAGKFCLDHQQLCHNAPEFTTLVSKLADPLSAGCKVESHEKENNVIASLKGLRNTRHLPDEVAHKIVQCALDKSAKTRVRVAAIEAFFADASKSKVLEAATTILKDIDEDSELRIKAYLALVEHPSQEVADTIKNLIDNEPINQVGSFIVSHLRNLRASVSPEKEAAKKVYGNIISKKKYPIDDRKFSKNYEVSYSLDALNIGAVGEVNRIFSQKSFVPRSMSLNLTTQIFGHSLNLAEVGLRAENFERILEKYFGPKGVVKSKGAELLGEVADKAEEAVKQAKEKAEGARPKRSISKQEAENAVSKIEFGPDYEDLDLDLDLSVKLFGSDIAWVNYHHKPIDYDRLKGKFNSKLDETADKGKGIDIDYKKARRFLDVGVTYPTGLGFGLKVKVNVNTAVNIKLKGQLDVKAILNNPKNTHIALQLVPSASLEVQSQLILDADVVEAGLKVSANLHSSTGSDLTVKVLDGYGIDFKLGLPVKKQEIISFHTDIVSIVKEKKSNHVESPVKFNVIRHEREGCFDQLSTLLGLTVCGVISLPANGFTNAAYGPSKASLRVEKDDESLTAYHIKLFYNNKEPDQVSVELLLDTPNSRTNRKFSLHAQAITKPEKQLLVTLVSPFKQVSFEALVTDTEREQTVSAKLISDGTEYSFKAGAHVTQEGNRKKYEPLLEYKYPESTKSERVWIGRKGTKGKQSQQTAVGISGAVYVEQNPGSQLRKYELKSVTLTTPKGKATVDGTVTLDEKLVSADLKASYDQETYTVSTKVVQLAEHKYLAKVSFVPSAHPDISGSVLWEYERTQTQIQNKIVIIHGADLESESARLTIAQLIKFNYESSKSFDFYTDNSVSYPLLAVSGAIKGGATPKSVNYDIYFGYDKTQIGSKLDAKVGPKHPTDYSIEFVAKALGNSISLSSKHEHTSTSTSTFTNSLELNPGGKYSLNGNIDLGSKPDEVFKSVSAELVMPQDPKIVKFHSEVKQNNKVSELGFEVSAGNKDIVNVELKLVKVPEPSGSFKVLLQKLVNSHGSFQTNGGKTTGAFQVVILKTGREIKGSGELIKSDKVVKGFAEVLFDAKNDPSKKIHVETDTHLTGKTVDTKNKLQLLNKITELNVKYNLDGTLNDGTLSGDAEVVLPDGKVVKFKVNRVLHLSLADKQAEGTWEVAYYQAKGTDPHNWELKLAAKNINLVKAQFSGQADFTYTSPTRENLLVHLGGKKLPNGDKWTLAGEGLLSGSLLKHPLSTKFNAEVSDELLKGHLTPDKKLPPGEYEFELKADNDVVVHSSGKVNVDQFNNELELKVPEFVKASSPELVITSLKWQTTNNVNLLTADNSELKVLSNNALHWNDDKFVKLGTDLNHKGVETHGKVTWESHVLSPRTLQFKLYNDDKAEKGEIDLDLQYEGKTAELNVKIDGYTVNPAKVKISSNIPGHGKYEADIHSFVAEDGGSGELTVLGTANNQNYNYSAKYSLSETTPYVDIVLDTPEGPNRVFGKLVKKGEHHGTVENKIVLKYFSWELNGEVNIHSLNDFFLKLYVDSPKLNINKFEFEAKRELSKSAAQKIAFHGKADGKEFTGSLAVASKGTSPNADYAGNGVVNVGGNSYPIEFTLKREKQSLANGYIDEGVFDVKVGSYTTTLKSTLSKEGTVVKIEYFEKFCHSAKCKTNEYKLIHEKKGPLDTDGDVTYEVSLEVFPFTSMGLKQQLVIKGKSSKDGWKYSDNVEISHGPNKLQYKDYLNDEHTGFELNLPKRTIAGEVAYNVKKSSLPSLKIEGYFWLDKKNSPDKKTSLVLNSNVNDNSQATLVLTEARFHTPGLKGLSLKGSTNFNKKGLVLNSKYEVDVFAKESDKLVVEYKSTGKNENDGISGSDSLHVYSKGLNIDTTIDSKISYKYKTSFEYALTGYYIDSAKAKREAAAKFSFDQKSYNALVKIPEAILYSADLKSDSESNKYHLKGTFQILDLQFEEIVELTATNLKVTFIQKKEGAQQLEFNVGAVPSKVAEVSAKFNNKPLVSLEVALDEAHFLKSNYNFNTDAAKDLLNLWKSNNVALAKEASRVFKESLSKLSHEATDRVEDLRKALVNPNSAVTYYKKELEELKEEFISNKEFKDAIDFFNNTFGVILKQIGEILKEVTFTTERLINILNEALKKVTESVNVVIPKLKKLYEDASNIVIQQLEAVLDFATSLINDVLDKIKEHEKDIKEITSVVTDFFEDVGHIFSKAFGGIYKEAKDFLSAFCDQVQALSAYTILQQKIQEIKNYKIPLEFWVSYHDVVASAEKLLPTPELQHLFKYLADLIEKVVKNEHVNKPEVLEHLYKELVAALRSVIAILEAHKPQHSSNIHDTVVVPVPSVGLLVAPPGTFRVSLLNWIRSTDLPSLSDVFHAYRPQYSPFNVIPPFKASALLIDGTEFFTFDKKHYSFKGSCSYLLTKDVIDSNFTVVANLEAGKLNSIAVYDHENIIELQHDNKVLVNNQPSEMPVHAGDLHLWNKYDIGIGFASNSGLKFFCTPHLKICGFSINGFYFGKTRGLLGTYNNEPYDDMVIPNGKTATSTSEFTNSWKTSAQCANGAVHEQPAPPADECTKLFSGDSSLRGCFPFNNPDSFREACNKLVAEASSTEKQEQACSIATGYAGSCLFVHFARVSVPDYCSECQVGSQKLKVGDSITVKSPQKEADVVFVIEQLLENEEVFKDLVKPLVTTLISDFKSHGITDVNIALIGWGAPEQQWPSLYTFDGKYNGFKGTVKNIYFTKEENVTDPKLSDRLKELKKTIEYEIGTTKMSLAYREAFAYPFRPQAAKTVIGVHASKCHSAVLPFKTLRMVYNVINQRLSGIVTNIILPLKDLELEGKDEKTAANIVGFDSESFYTHYEAKNKVLKGNEEEYDELKYSSDPCVAYTLMNKGSVFSSTNFINAKPPARKNFIQVLSKKITESLTTEELTQECKCELEKGIHSKSKCIIVSRKEKELVTKGGVKGGVKA